MTDSLRRHLFYAFQKERKMNDFKGVSSVSNDVISDQFYYREIVDDK